MKIQKNANLKVSKYDKESRQFMVEYEGNEYPVRRTGHELPESLNCRIVKSNEEVEITPEVDDYFHNGAIRRFTVKSDMRDSAGVYELVDDCGFVVYLYGAENYKFFKGKRLLCRVISTDGVRPHVMLYEENYKSTGSAFSVSKVYVNDLILKAKESEWDADSLADLILYDGMDDPFDVKCYEWVIAQTSEMQNSGCLEKFLHDVRGCCMNLIEKSELLCECSSDEVPILLDRLTLITEHMGYVKTAMSTISDGQEESYVADLLEKLKTSGYLYHPTKHFCVATYLFRIKPDLMNGMIEELFDVIRSRDLLHWRKEPFRSEIIKQLETYIKSNDHETIRHPDNRELFYRGFQALAIQLLLANEDEDLIDVSLNRSMMCRYASHLKFANKKRMGDMSLNSLLSLFKNRLRYSLLDTATPDKFYYYIENWGRNQEIDRNKRAVYRSKDLVLSIEDDKITLAPDVATDLKSVFNNDVPLWKGMNVRLEKKYAKLPQKPQNGDLMSLNEKIWQKIEANLFDVKRVAVKKEVKQRVIPEVGECVYAYVYKQSSKDKNIFHCRIADEEKGYIGEGLISVRGEEGAPGIVTYYPEPTIEDFLDENGHPHLMAMVVAGKTDDNICIMDMKELITDSLKTDKPNFMQDCVVGKVNESNSTVLAISSEGFSVYVTYSDVDLSVGDNIRVILNERKWIQNDFLQGSFDSMSSETITPKDAFGALIRLFSIGGYETVIDETANEVNLEKSHVIEILNIIDVVASIEEDIHISYNYLGFAAVLSQMIGSTEREKYYKGQMAVAQMLHKFAVTNDVNDEQLQQLHKFNEDILSSNYNLRHQYFKLYAVSMMGNENDEWLLKMREDSTDENLTKLVSLVYSYNILLRAGIDTSDVKQAIKDLLRLKGRDAYFKTYTVCEGVDVEFKSSIVYPPNTMRPDIVQQTFNIMKELCAFLNHKGGVLYLGVNDQGGGQGLEEDMKHEYFRDSRDKYDNYVRNQIVAQLGQEASHCIEGHFDDDARGRDVYILEVNPCEHPVRLASHYYQRHGSSSRKVDQDYLPTFLKNRPAEYRKITRVREEELVEVVADAVEAPEKEEASPRATQVHNIPTSSLRKNVLNDYEDGYVYPDAYIRMRPNHRYVVARKYNYQQNDDMLTLVITSEEVEGYLLLVYEDAKVGKVSMDKILDKDDGREYSRYNGANLVFACPVQDDDVLFQEYEFKGETHYRFQNVSDIEEINMGEPGVSLFDSQFDSLVRNEVVHSDKIHFLPKRITDRKKIGYAKSKKDGIKSLEALKKIGLS